MNGSKAPTIRIGLLQKELPGILPRLPLLHRRISEELYSLLPDIHECADTSSSVEVQINPLPTGDLIGSTDTICAGEPLYGQIQYLRDTSSLFGDYRRRVQKETDDITASPDTIQFYPSSTQSYSMLQIVDDSGCVADNSLFTDAGRSSCLRSAGRQRGER